MVFDNKMWIMGGWYNGRNPGASASNQVWCSTNGSDWTQTTAAAPWAARCGAGGAVFNSKMWIIGGTEQYYYGDDGSLLNDVWSSSDGVTWEPATLNAPWSPRAYHQVLAFDDKLWVLGGGSYTPGLWSLNDVWNSSDGVNWTKVAEHAPWDSRIWFSAEVYDDRMWILGGSTAGGTWLRNDVWSSGDGTTWTQLQTDAVWTPRHEMSTYVFQNKLWLVGGYDVAHLVNDVWRLDGVISGPIAVDDSYGVDEDTMLDVPAIGVLQNDTDPENDPLSARGVSEPSHGTLSLRNDGSFTYNPDPDFFGTDSFTYKASDLIDDSNVATVRIAVNPINDFPVAVDDEYSVDANGDLWTAHGVLENDYDVDGDDLTVDAGHPAHGTVTMYSDGSFHYAPEEGFWGIDHFTYALFDGVDDAGVDMATVTITVWTPGDANRDGFVDDRDASVCATLAPGNRREMGRRRLQLRRSRQRCGRRDPRRPLGRGRWRGVGARAGQPCPVGWDCRDVGMVSRGTAEGVAAAGRVFTAAIALPRLGREPPVGACGLRPCGESLIRAADQPLALKDFCQHIGTKTSRGLLATCVGPSRLQTDSRPRNVLGRQRGALRFVAP